MSQADDKKKPFLCRSIPIWTVGVAIVIIGMWLTFWLWSGIRTRNIRDTERALIGFYDNLGTAVIESRVLPGNSLNDALNIILKARQVSPDLYNLPSDRILKYLQDNQDPWGNKFIYERKDDGYRIIVRSLGPNSRDEQGKGDDIQIIKNLNFLKQHDFSNSKDQMK